MTAIKTKETVKQTKARLKREAKVLATKQSTLPLKMQEFNKTWATMSRELRCSTIVNFVNLYGTSTFRDIPFSDIMESLNDKCEFANIEVIYNAIPTEDITVSEVKLIIAYVLPVLSSHAPLYVDELIDSISNLCIAEEYLDILKSLIPHTPSVLKSRLLHLISSVYTMEETPEYLEQVEALKAYALNKQHVVDQIKVDSPPVMSLVAHFGIATIQKPDRLSNIDVPTDLERIIGELDHKTKTKQILVKFFGLKA